MRTFETGSWELIEGILDFANWPAIESTKAVENHFASLLGAMGKPEAVPPIGKDEVAAYRKDQRRVRQLVDLLVEGGDEALSKFERMIERDLGAVNLSVVMDGDSLRMAIDSPRVKALCALGLALIVDKGAVDQVRRCELPECTNVLLTQGGRRGMPKKYCSHEHYREHDVQKSRERARRWRQSRKNRRT